MEVMGDTLYIVEYNNELIKGHFCRPEEWVRRGEGWIRVGFAESQNKAIHMLLKHERRLLERNRGSSKKFEISDSIRNHKKAIA